MVGCQFTTWPESEAKYGGFPAFPIRKHWGWKRSFLLGPGLFFEVFHSLSQPWFSWKGLFLSHTATEKRWQFGEPYQRAWRSFCHFSSWNTCICHAFQGIQWCQFPQKIHQTINVFFWKVHVRTTILYNIGHSLVLTDFLLGHCCFARLRCGTNCKTSRLRSKEILPSTNE